MVRFAGVVKVGGLYRVEILTYQNQKRVGVELDSEWTTEEESLSRMREINFHPQKEEVR